MSILAKNMTEGADERTVQQVVSTKKDPEARKLFNEKLLAREDFYGCVVVCHLIS